MADNKIYTGDHITLELDGIESGDPVAVNDIVGVALIDTDGEGNVVIARRGVFELEVHGDDGSAESSEIAIDKGEKVYADMDGDKVDELNAASSEAHFGYALEDVGSGDKETIKILLRD